MTNAAMVVYLNHPSGEAGHRSGPVAFVLTNANHYCADQDNSNVSQKTKTLLSTEKDNPSKLLSLARGAAPK